MTLDPQYSLPPSSELDAAVHDVIENLGAPLALFWDRRDQEEDVAGVIRRRFSETVARLEERARLAEAERDRALAECERLRAALATGKGFD